MPTTVRLNNGLSLRTSNLKLAMNGKFEKATELKLSKFSEAWNTIKHFLGFETDQDKVKNLVSDLQAINNANKGLIPSEKNKLDIFKEIVAHVNKEDQERFTVEITTHCNGGIDGTVKFLLRGKDEENIELHSMEVADIYKFVRCDSEKIEISNWGNHFVSEPSDIKIKCKIITTYTDTTINPEVKEFCNNVNQTSELFINNTNIPEDMALCCKNFNEQVIIDWDSKEDISVFKGDVMDRGHEWIGCNGDNNYLQKLQNIGKKKLNVQKVTKEETLMVCAGMQTINASSSAAVMPNQFGISANSSCGILSRSRKAIGFEYNKGENTMVITSNVDVMIYTESGTPTGKEACTTRETYKILDFTDRKITLQCVGMNIYQQELLI